MLPLWKETTSALRKWLSIREGVSIPEFFLNARGVAMTRAGFEYILANHVKTAAVLQESLAEKRISPHILRHSCAMHMLHATHDVRKVALWLGHAKLQSTEIYLRADPTEKLETLMAGAPPKLRPGQFRRPDKLLALLQSAKKTDKCGAPHKRKSFNGLYAQVGSVLEQEPTSGHLFVFANRHRNRLKIVWWDGSGLWICAKRLEKGTFGWPQGQGVSRSLRPEELLLLLHGIEGTPRPNWHRL